MEGVGACEIRARQYTGCTLVHRIRHRGVEHSLHSNMQAVLRSVCEIGRRAAKTKHEGKLALSFYAVLACEVIAASHRVTEPLVALLAPFLQQGLNIGAAPGYRAATFMVVAQLLSHATLSQILLTSATPTASGSAI